MSFDVFAATAYLTCGAVMLFLGFVVLRENPRQRVNRATAAMLVFGGLGPILGATGAFAGRDGGGARLLHDGFQQFAFLWEFFFPSALLFALVFPTLQPYLRRHGWIVPVLFVPHAFHVLLVMLFSESTNLWEAAVPGSLERVTRVVRIALELLFRAHVRFFSFINLTMAAASLVLLLRSWRRTLNPKLRSQVRTITIGLGLTLVLYSGGELVPRVFGAGLPGPWSVPVVTVSLLVGAVSIVVAIVRLGFLDVRFIVRRGLGYGLAAGAVIGLYLLVGKQIDKFSAQLVGARVPVFETTFLVLSLFLLQPVLSGIERLVDRGYTRDRSDLRNALTRLAEEVSVVLDPDRVCEQVATTLRREMVLRSVAVVRLDRNERTYGLSLARQELETAADWAPGAALFQALEGRQEPVRVQELVEHPAEAEERDRLAAGLGWLGVETVIPLYAAGTSSNGKEAPAGSREMVGALCLGEKVTETRITFEEMSLLSLVAHQVAISLQNGALHEERVATRLLQEEVSTARRIQQQLLPTRPPAVPGWELSASNNPSRHIGGDYHDFLPLAGGALGIAIGDVSGKGVPAALLMSNLQAALRGRLVSGEPPERVVGAVNEHMCRNTGPESFVSFFLGGLDPERGTMVYTNAGHNEPILVRRDGRVELLDIGGLLLGVFPGATYERGEVTLEPGDSLALYTDGVTEARSGDDEGEMFDDERLVNALVRARDRSATAMHDEVLKDVRAFQKGRPPDDDLTLVLLKRVVQESGVRNEAAGEDVRVGG